MIEYWQQNMTIILKEAGQHLIMVLLSLLLASLLAILMVAAFFRKSKWLNSLVYFFSLLYSIPSFAFFVLLLPIFGLGMKTAVVVLTTYCEYILLRSFITGIQGVNPLLIQVARGMGMNSRQIFWRVQMPLALPAIFSGIQVALASTMAIATIAATINAGGLGQLLFEGLQSQQVVPMLWGTIVIVCLTVFCAGCVGGVQWLLTHSWRSYLD